MNVGPSSSGGETEVDALSSLFPQVDRDILRAVLQQESCYEAAVEALLESVVAFHQPKTRCNAVSLGLPR